MFSEFNYTLTRNCLICLFYWLKGCY
jgi:hypothetical protein